MIRAHVRSMDADSPLRRAVNRFFLDARTARATCTILVILGALGLLYMLRGALLGDVQADAVEVAPASTSAERRPEHLTAVYREQMKRTQERLRDLGYAPGPIDGIIGSGTAGALRAFQEQEGLRVTGRANPETLAALGIEDRLRRAP